MMDGALRWPMGYNDTPDSATDETNQAVVEGATAGQIHQNAAVQKLPATLFDLRAGNDDTEAPFEKAPYLKKSIDLLHATILANDAASVRLLLQSGWNEHVWKGP